MCDTANIEDDRVTKMTRKTTAKKTKSTTRKTKAKLSSSISYVNHPTIEYCDSLCDSMKYVGQWDEASQTLTCSQVGLYTGRILASDKFNIGDIANTMKYNHNCRLISLFSHNSIGVSYSFANKVFKEFVANNRIL